MKWCEETLDMDILGEGLKQLSDILGDNWPSGLPENSEFML